MTIHDWIRAASVRLAAANVEASRLEAQLLAAHTMGQPRAYVLAHPEAGVPEPAEALLERRLRGEPLAYILGYREFFGREFTVTPAVLIPRQETEILVEAVLARTDRDCRVLDVGTGSGCIAITLKQERPDLQVSACDISNEALVVAKANAGRLQAEVEFRQGNLLEGQRLREVIVSNPPYIRLDASLPIEVGSHEPPSALYAGEDGLDFYRRFAAEAPGHLTLGGLLALELGDDMAPGVGALFEGPVWQTPEILPDLSGRMRVLLTRRLT